MNISDDNTNELDSYGVWVKNSKNDDGTSTENQDTLQDSLTEEIPTDDSSLDLPDFNDSDFSDMFKDDSQFSSELNKEETFSDDLDSTLSTDELANITDLGNVTVEQVDAPENFDTNDFDFSDISSDSLDDNNFSETSNDISPEEEIAETSLDAFSIDIPEETSVSEDELSIDIPEETSVSEDELSIDNPIEETGDTAASEVSLDDFSIDEPADDSIQSEISEDHIIDDSESKEESLDDFDISDDSSDSANSSVDEEISLDDFMDEGFSDESVAAGNNGYEPGAGPSASGETEELSLDDFMDGDSFDMAPPEAKAEEVIEDEPPLEMDISFDDSAESVETEDNIAIENDNYDTDEDFEDESDEITNDQSAIDANLSDTSDSTEVSLDDFGASFESSSSSAGDENINTEDVDLSDFGIDANAEETPITQDVAESKLKDTAYPNRIS